MKLYFCLFVVIITNTYLAKLIILCIIDWYRVSKAIFISSLRHPVISDVFKKAKKKTKIFQKKENNLPGDGEVRDSELLLIEFILWGVATWVKELRRGARGVAVGVVEAEEAAELFRLWL